MEFGGIIMAITEKKGQQSGNKKSITVVNQETREGAYIRTKSNAFLMKKSGKSLRTVQRWKQKGKLPKNQSTAGLRKTAKRAGKKAFYAEKKVSVKDNFIGKWRRKEVEARRAARTASSRAARRQKLMEADAYKLAADNAAKMTLAELVGLTNDLRTDNDWREWEVSYESMKGTLFSVKKVSA